MIILPDQYAPKGVILMPMKKLDWMPPSQRRSLFGRENLTRWRVRVSTHSGMWRSWFHDREDCDAFLRSLILGTLHQDRALWRLPQPAWPGLGPGLWYAVDTVTLLTTPTGSNQTFTSPADWDDAANLIECLGAGGSGNTTGTGTSRAWGGGGAYSSTPNFVFASPGVTTATYQIGTGGAGVTGTTGNAGGDTWWNSSTLAGSNPGAKGGGGGTSGGPGAGGASASGFGTNKFSGGAGTANGSGSRGGGGAAGPAGAGGAGSTTAGGSANNGATAGPTVAGNGVSGTEWTTDGCGTGGYGASGQLGGSHGGGGCGTTSGTSGAGRDGLIAVTYTPKAGSGACLGGPLPGM